MAVSRTQGAAIGAASGGMGGGMGFGAGMGAALPGVNWQSQSTQEVGMGALGGAASGAMMGAMVGGPVGAVAGGVIGLGVGALGGVGQSKARKAQEAAIRAQQEMVRAEMGRRAQGVAKARETFGDVWSFANKDINAKNKFQTSGEWYDQQDPSKFQNLGKTITRHGEIAGGIESQAGVVREAGQQQLGDSAQQAAVANRASMANRGLMGSSLGESAKQALLAQYAGNRANLAAGVEATRQGGWDAIRSRQAQFENMAQGGQRITGQQMAGANASAIAGARAQMPVATFGNLLNTGLGVFQAGALAEAQGGAGLSALGLPKLGVGPGSQDKASGVFQSGGTK